MGQLLEQRENWGSRGSFVLAAIGAAVGLGNLWGFPYKLYSFGGGAFLIPYILALFVVGLPILILEFSMGHFTQRAAPNAFKRCGRPFEYIGWFGLAMCIVIITYYPVILAYCFTYFWYSVMGIFNGGDLPWAAHGIDGVKVAGNFFFKDYLNYHESLTLGAIQWKIAVPLVLTWILMHLSIFKGVNLVGKIVWITVPIPWLMLMILAVRGLTLEGSVQGMAYYLTPIWSELAKPTTWRYAFGQVFFSMSIAYGTMITYASFLHKKSDLNNNALIISISDFATSFVAGIAIFATLGGMAYITAQAGEAVGVDKIVDNGVSLAFIAFPYALAQLPYSAWFSFFFFLALITLGIDSAFSITETLLAGIVDKTGLKRSTVLPIITGLGILSSLVYITQGGLNWVGVIDGIVNGTFGISLLGLLECLAIGWYYRLDILRNHTNDRSEWKLGRMWDILIRLVLPVILGMLFLWNFHDDINRPGGLLHNETGGFAIDKVVTLIVTLTAFALSLWVTVVKDNSQNADTVGRYSRLAGANKSESACLAISFLVLIAGVWLLFTKDFSAFSETLFVATLVVGSAIMFASHRRIVEHYSGNYLPGWVNGNAGACATIGVSAALTAALVRFSNAVLAAGVEGKAAVPHTLSGISYIILTAVFLIIVVGLGWSFYRVITAAETSSRDVQTTETI